MARQGSEHAGHLVDQSGGDGEATTPAVTRLLRAGTFFWLDLEGPDDDQLAAYCRLLGARPEEVVRAGDTAARSAFRLHSDSASAVLPAAVDEPSKVWLDAHYVSALVTDRHLLTVHSVPSSAIERARRLYLEEDDDQARADPARTLFLVLDSLLDTFMPQLLALDDRLADIQLSMLDKMPRGVHDELVQILGIITEGIQELGWYDHDLDESAETIATAHAPWPQAPQRLDQHRRRVHRMRDNGKEIREEAKNALAQYSEAIAARQAQVLGSLTIVATVFLPLSFLTGYFGMNFAVLTQHFQAGWWAFVLLGVLLPVASAGLSLLLIRRLERRSGIGGIGPPR